MDHRFALASEPNLTWKLPSPTIVSPPTRSPTCIQARRSECSRNRRTLQAMSCCLGLQAASCEHPFILPNCSDDWLRLTLGNSVSRLVPIFHHYREETRIGKAIYLGHGETLDPRSRVVSRSRPAYYNWYGIFSRIAIVGWVDGGHRSALV